MNLSTLPRWATALLESERVGRLALLDTEGRPRALPVTYAIGGGAAWTAIDRKPKRRAEPARVRWLRRRPAAALTVDTYDDDWERLAWVQLLGDVVVLDAAAAGAGIELLAGRYPQYEAEPPPGPLLRLDVGRALCWRAAEV